MKNLDAITNKSGVDRRSFLRTAGTATAALAAVGIAPKMFAAPVSNATPKSPDTPAEIFTAALVAEDLATCFYYYALTGPVIQNINLAGPGGTATHVTAQGSVSNVGYLRAALYEEIEHANLFRSLLGISASSGDPYQNFYLPSAGFDTLDGFIAVVQALENAFIAAYMAAVQEFALLAAVGQPQTFNGTTYYPKDFAYYAKIASSILGVECEHRALGRAIDPYLIPANEINYEQSNNVYSVYNGEQSAVVALTPFLSPGSGLQQCCLQTALNKQSSVSIVTGYTIPPEYF